MSESSARPGKSAVVGAQPEFAAWRALGMLIQLGVTDPANLAAARELLADDLAALDLACSRFRPDSELVAVGNAARSAPGPVTIPVSALLAEAVEVSLRAAELTDGDVDPTVGGVMAALGYDRDFAELQAAETLTPEGAGPGAVTVRTIPGWRSVSVDVAAGKLTVPAGVQLDLGATVKGWAADCSAAKIADRLGCGVLVSLGGDTAVAGSPPEEAGWPIRVQDTTLPLEDSPDGPSQVVSIRSGGLATSSTAARRWHHGGDVLHHILDPRTGLPAAPVWRTVSVAAATCADANTAATAAIIRGHRAPAWLASLNLPARLVSVEGEITAVSGWPPLRFGPTGGLPDDLKNNIFLYPPSTRRDRSMSTHRSCAFATPPAQRLISSDAVSVMRRPRASTWMTTSGAGRGRSSKPHRGTASLPVDPRRTGRSGYR
jgi:thiamine biosynthesis lipoprotein ApbE